LKLQFEDELYKEVKMELENKVMTIPKYEECTLDGNGLL
jgi:hypothetical protein